jgi:hypothetical protein
MHLYIVVNCKTEDCKTVHVFMHLGEKGQTSAKPEYWMSYPLMDRVGLVYMRLDPHLPKLYPRAHADVGACHERRYAYGCDLVLPRLGQGVLLAS